MTRIAAKFLSLASINTLLAVMVFAGAGCGSRKAEAENEKPALTINKLQLSSSDLRQELQTRFITPYASASSGGQEPEWISQIIDRELLVQEAQRLGLDRQQDFMRTIERFWKQALIKSLIDAKSREINAAIHIYEPQIEARYKKLAAEEDEKIEPLASLRTQIIRTLQDEAAEKTMEDWISQIRKQADIKIDDQALREIEKP